MTTGISRGLHKNLTKKQLDYIVQSRFSGETFSNYTNNGIPQAVRGYNNLDKVQEYCYNSFGYRSKEFKEAPHILCSGDSNTFGVGLPEKSTWPHMLLKDTKSRFVPINLALPGASVESIVDDVFHYIKTYGSPKNLFIVFPDFCRGVFFANPEILISERNGKETGPANVLLGHLMGKDAERPYTSKRPHLVEDVINIEHTYLSSFRQIRHLEDFCIAANINFKWSVWQDDLEVSLINRYKNSQYFSQYLDAESGTLWVKDINRKKLTYNSDENCHAEDRENHGEVFELATDIQPHHDGAHMHIHIAEKFLPYVID